MIKEKDNLFMKIITLPYAILYFFGFNYIHKFGLGFCFEKAEQNFKERINNMKFYYKNGYFN